MAAHAWIVQSYSSSGTNVHPSNICFLGTTKVHISNDISIGFVVFAGLTTVTDRPTDRQTDHAATGHMYVRSTAMRPNNNVNCT